GKQDCVTPAPKWQVAGTSVPKVNAREMVTGKHKYASDHKLPEMFYGRVLRPPSFGAKLVSVDTSAAARMQDVTVVRDGDFTELAETFGLSENQIHVLMPDTGAAYGGKHTGECAVEAARLAKGAGKPVKLVWTREEEFTWAYFRPAGVIEIQSGVAEDGTLISWEFD